MGLVYETRVLDSDRFVLLYICQRPRQELYIYDGHLSPLYQEVFNVRGHSYDQLTNDRDLL
jgi:hypothetical protein